MEKIAIVNFTTKFDATISDMLKCVANGEFKEKKEYIYRIHKTQKLKVGDIVMTELNGNCHLSKVVKIIESDEFKKNKIEKSEVKQRPFILGVIDANGFIESFLVDKRIEELTAEMNDIEVDIDIDEKRKRYAEINPEFAKVYNELKQIKG